MDDRRTTVGQPTAASDARTPRYNDGGDGWTLAAELLTATFVWGGIGWLVDGWLETAPVLMVLGFVLGNALGVYLIWVRSQDRFVREHTQLMARRARSRPAAPGIVSPRIDAAAPADATATPAPSADGPRAGDLLDGHAPEVPDDDEVVAPIYGGDRRD